MAGVPLQISALVKNNVQMEYFFKMLDISLWKCHDFLWPVLFISFYIRTRKCNPKLIFIPWVVGYVVYTTELGCIKQN